MVAVPLHSSTCLPTALEILGLNRCRGVQLLAPIMREIKRIESRLSILKLALDNTLLFAEEHAGLAPTFKATAGEVLRFSPRGLSQSHE